MGDDTVGNYINREVRAMKKLILKGLIICSAIGAIGFLLFFNHFNKTAVSANGVTHVTDQQVADAVAGGQRYLFKNFTDQGAGLGGYWDDGESQLAATASAVAALIETGMYKAPVNPGDPDFRPLIDKGIIYIKSFYKAPPGDGGIYNYNWTYENGLSLVALSLYDAAHTQGAAYQTMIQNAVNSLIAGQIHLPVNWITSRDERTSLNSVAGSCSISFIQ